MITSFILAQKAVDDEKIISDSAENYFPQNWTVPTGSGDKKITLAQLMTTTSGLPHYPKTLQESIENVKNLDDMYAAWEDYAIEDLESDLGETTLSFDPGDEYLYSDFGFALVQKTTEELYEKDFPQILADFSQMMGLKNTVVPENLSEDQKNNLFYGHGGALIVPMPEPVVTPVFTGDGFIYSDAEDMGRLLRVFAGIDNAPSDNVTKTLELMTKERFPRFAGEVSIAQGLGIGIITEGDFTIYKKNGTSAGTTTAFLWDDKNNLGVSVAGNIIPFSEGINGLVCDIYSLIYLDHSGKVIPDNVYQACLIPF
jgi:CubicO group peptidase (beta-lactamase class C family)